MEAKEKNPIVLVEAISILPSLVKTLGSIFKRKTKEKAEKINLDPSTPAGAAIVGHLKDAVSGEISSTRLLNVGGSLIIIYIAWEDIALNGLTSKNIALVGVGALYSAVMAFITYLKDRSGKE